MQIEAAPIGATFRPLLNGKSLGIIESNVEVAFSYWGQRARQGASLASRAGETRPRIYTLQRVSYCQQKGSYVPDIEYRFKNGDWVGV